jgi:WD40 repeat protein
VVTKQNTKISTWDISTGAPHTLFEVQFEVNSMTIANHMERKVIALGSSTGHLQVRTFETDLLIFPEPTDWNLIELFNSNRENIDVGRVEQIDIQSGAIAILGAGETVRAMGVILPECPKEVQHFWPLKDGIKYGSIALYEDGKGFITGRNNGFIYTAACDGVSATNNHQEKVFDDNSNVCAVSMYPRKATKSTTFTYIYFTVAGTASKIRFFCKDDNENKFQLLESYIIPVLSTSDTAYNGTIAKIVPRQQTEDDSFNPYRKTSSHSPFGSSSKEKGGLAFGAKPKNNLSIFDSKRREAVIHTLFSPDGQYFAYGTTDGFVGILNWNLLKPERILIDEKQTADEKYWAKLRFNDRLPGAWQE